MSGGAGACSPTSVAAVACKYSFKSQCAKINQTNKNLNPHRISSHGDRDTEEAVRSGAQGVRKPSTAVAGGCVGVDGNRRL